MGVTPDAAPSALGIESSWRLDVTESASKTDGIRIVPASRAYDEKGKLRGRTAIDRNPDTD
ncbi:MAG: hypothetical protein M3472_04410 [Chloroflexota bacterium]|nr:hypothetical protein [Chloroflexota bacterium]